MKVKKLIDSFAYALEGVGEALREERNLKIHFVIAILVLILALLLQFSRLEFVLLLLTISLVLVMELFNTVVERIIDLVCPEYNPKARFIKNVAAGAVLIAAINSAVIGFFLFYNRFEDFSLEFFYWIRYQPAYFSFLLILALFSLLLIIKTKSKEKFTLQGGMPSIHSALAFSLATAAGFLAENSFLIISGYILAFLVGQSRIEGEIHNFSEVILGAFLGIIFTIFIFQLFAGGTV